MMRILYGIAAAVIAAAAVAYAYFSNTNSDGTTAGKAPTHQSRDPMGLGDAAYRNLKLH